MSQGQQLALRIKHGRKRAKKWAASGWDLVWRGLRAATGWTVSVPLPKVFYILWLNRKLEKTYEPSVTKAQIRNAKTVDKDASIALWQADTDRLNGLAAKAAAVLAADALIAAALVTQTSSRGWALAMCVVSTVYLVSGAVAACAVQVPKARQFVLPEDVLHGNAERRMVEVVAGNESLGIRTQNLAYVGIRDTFLSLVALILVFVLNL